MSASDEPYPEQYPDKAVLALDTEPPTEMDVFYRKLKEDYIQDSIRTLTESAKQVIAIIPIIISVLTIGFSYIKTKGISNGMSAAGFFVILICLSAIFSICLSMISIIPSITNTNLLEVSDMETIMQKRIKKKYHLVVSSYFFLIISLIQISILCVIVMNA